MILPNKLIGLFFTLGLGLLTGCESMFHDDLDNCPQAVYVKLYNTTCKADLIGLNTQSSVHLFAFDEENRLAASAEFKDIDLGNKEKGFKEIKLPIKSSTPNDNGVYNIYAWVGVNSKFNVQEPKIGTTKKDELFATLKTDADASYLKLDKDQVYVGMSSHSVVLKNPAQYGTQEEHIAVAVGEQTYRLNVSVELDKSIYERLSKPSIKDFAIEIASANATYNYDASHANNSATAKYAPNAGIHYGENVLSAQYTLLDLQSGLKSSVRITNRNPKDGKVKDVEMPQEIQQDLIAAILAYASKPENKFSFNLNCEHDINLKFLIKDKCLDCGNYMCAGVFINDWLVHTFQTTLE